MESRKTYHFITHFKLNNYLQKKKRLETKKQIEYQISCLFYWVNNRGIDVELLWNCCGIDVELALRVEKRIFIKINQNL